MSGLAGDDGISPAEKIGCRRFDRNDPLFRGLIQAEYDQLVNAPGRPHYWDTLQALLPIEALYLADEPVYNVIELETVIFSMADFGDLPERILEDFDDANVPERITDRSQWQRLIEWVFGLLFDHPDVHRYSTPVEMRMVLHHCRSRFWIETATVQLPSSCGTGSFMAPPTSYRGKMLGFVGLPDAVAERAYSPMESEEMVHYGKTLQSFANAKSKHAPDDAKTIAEAAEWFVFWGERGCCMQPWA